MSGARKKPFSAKQKKEQLREKRQKKREESEGQDSEDDAAPGPRPKSNIRDIEFVKAQPDDRDKLVSVFNRLDEKTIQARKEESMQPYKQLPMTAVESGFEDFSHATISIPKRPPWTFDMSKEALEQRERSSFEKWKSGVYEKFESEKLSFFEHNLEVWRQLWRVCEMSDIVLFVVDVRHPVLHFPKSLFEYVTVELGKPMVVVFTKIDLVAADTLFAWKQYFSKCFPELYVSSFSVYSLDDFEQVNDTTLAALQKRVSRKKKRYYRAVGVHDVLSSCREVPLKKHGIDVDWESLIAKYSEEHEDILLEAEEPFSECEDSDDDDEASQKDEPENVHEEAIDDEYKAAKPNADWITLGLIGHPNVGKSSLINGIMGKKVVSASRTPGHTKHFQTIHLTKSVRLCDCPGLVFPSLIPRPLQILCGMYKIAQVQDPYTSVKYLAERISLPEILNLKYPYDLYTESPGTEFWSAWKICEAFAIQRGFFAARSARPDVYRSANMILRMTADGRILLSFKPPGFFSGKYLHVKKEILEREIEQIALQSDDDESEEDLDEGDRKANWREIVDEKGKPRAKTGGFFNALIDE